MTVAEKINRGDTIVVDGYVTVVKDVQKMPRFVGIRTGRSGGKYTTFNYGEQVERLNG